MGDQEMPEHIRKFLLVSKHLEDDRIERKTKELIKKLTSPESSLSDQEKKVFKDKIEKGEDFETVLCVCSEGKECLHSPSHKCLCSQIAENIKLIKGVNERHTYILRTDYLRKTIGVCKARRGTHTCTCLMSTKPCFAEFHHCNCTVLNRINIYPPWIKVECRAEHHTNSLVR
jgi:hypothetical protein